ncbi:MAG: aldehyde dehydrogenase family protein [Actinobacteria bacterium]|nr:aldehyde dehydrogenase family protein [Actinomycetota bacterium]
MAIRTRTDANGASGENGATFEVRKPADGSVLTTLPVDGPERVAEVVARVRSNQPAWEALGNRGRARWMYRLRDWLLDHQQEIADTMQAETGKVRAEAMGEAPYLVDLINFYGKKAERFIGEQKVPAHSPLMKTKKLRVQHRPYPVAGVISPWNFPLILALGDAIPALQAGAAVVIKPSELTPLGLGEVIEAWKRDIGGPDVFDIVNGAGETGAALVEEVDFVQFTGSDRTARKVLARAAETLTPVSAELGGKDPMIVLRSADMEKAVNAAAWGSFANTGQVCMSVERLYVEEPVYDEFVRRFTDEVKTLKQGVDGREYGMDQGAMTFPPQTEIVESHVADARERGATVLTGGERLQREGGDWYPPTVITDVDHSMKVMVDESFGPVVGVMKVRDADEAVRLANDTRYGLSGYVFGKTAEAEAVARKLEVGAACVNDVLVNFLACDVPMGGWKDSGIGFRHGEYGIKKFTRPESLVITRLGQKREPFYFPYTEKRRTQLGKVFALVNAKDWRRKLGRSG